MTAEVEHSERAHNEFGGSSAERNYNCQGNIALKLLKKIPDGESSSAAKEGTRFHELLDVCGSLLAAYYTKKGKLPKLDVLLDFPTKDNWPHSMQVHARVWFNQIYKEIKDKKPRKVFSELNVEYPEPLEAAGRDWHLGGPADFLFGYQDKNGDDHLFVADAKYGVGYVEETSLQLLFYGCCAAAKFHKRKFKTLTVAVYQPRCEEGDAQEPWRTHTYNQDDIYSWIRRFRGSAMTSLRLVGKDEKAISQYLTEGKWCGFCACKHVCPAWTAAANENAVIDFKDVEDVVIRDEITDPDSAARTLIHLLDSPEKLAKFLHFIPFLKKLISHAQDFAITKILEGDEEIPGWKVVDGRSQRRFKEEQAIVVAGLKELGIKDPFNRKLKGIGDIETELKGLGMTKKEAGQAIAPLVYKSTPGKNLVSELDIREAVQLDDSAVGDFDGIEI